MQKKTQMSFSRMDYLFISSGLGSYQFILISFFFPHRHSNSPKAQMMESRKAKETDFTNERSR